MFKKHFCFWGKSQVKDVAGCLFDRLRGQVASYIFLLKIISRVGTYQLAEGAVCDEAREDAWAKSPERSSYRQVYLRTLRDTWVQVEPSATLIFSYGNIMDSARDI